MATDKQREADAHRAYYYRNRDRILARNKAKSMQLHRRNKRLDEQRLNRLLAQIEPLEKPLHSIKGKPLARTPKTMFNPNFSVNESRALAPKLWRELQRGRGRNLSIANLKFVQEYRRTFEREHRLTPAQRRLERRAIKMYEMERSRPQTNLKEMEKAIKKSQLMEYIRGENPT